MPPVIAMSIQDIANQILTNTLPFSASGSAVPTFTKEFELSQNNIWANQVITVYRYVPGGIIKQGYEGFTWDLNLDNEVKQIKTLSKLDSGTYITPITNSQSEPNLGIVTIKKIGNLAYTTSDSYFPPSRSWSRKYTVFDEKRNQLIYITMNIKPDSQNYSSIKEKTICYEHQCTVIYIFPSEIENFFQEQQDILIGSLAKESLIKE
jgi:hypothetical protein